MKTLGLLLAAILVPGAMAMAIEERRPLMESSQQRRLPCSRYYRGCYSSISEVIEQQPPERPQDEAFFDSWIWSALKPSEPDSVTEVRLWNGTSSFYQKLQSLREFLMPEDQKENAQTAII